MGGMNNTLSLRERGGRMRVPFFCRTLPMLLPAVPASVSATDSHISPPCRRRRSDRTPWPSSAVRRDWAALYRLGCLVQYFTRPFGAVEVQERASGGDHERWPSRGRAALFSAARPRPCFAGAAARSFGVGAVSSPPCL